MSTWLTPSIKHQGTEWVNDVIVDRVICTLRLRASMRHMLGTKHCRLAFRNPLAEGWRSRDERIVHMRVMHLAERRAGRIAGGEVCLLSLAEKKTTRG